MKPMNWLLEKALKPTAQYLNEGVIMNFSETENWILRLTSLWADGVDTHATGIFIAGDLDSPGSVYDVVYQSGYDILNLEAELFTNTEKSVI